MGSKGNGPEQFNVPNGMTQSGDKLFVCDRSNHRIQILDLDLNFIGSSGCRGCNVGEFEKPVDIAFDKGDNMYIMDSGNNRVQVFTSDGTFLRTFGRRGSGPGELDRPVGILVDYYTVYVTDSGNERVSVFTTEGEYITSFGSVGNGNGEFRAPWGITMNLDGYLYVCDILTNNRVQVF